MFTLLEILLAGYVAFAIHNGEVYAKSGPWGRTISRDSSPEYFWVVICIYILMRLALIFIF